MKRAEVEERLKQHHQYCVALGQSKSLAALDEIAHAVFPAGSLPNESDPITFTERELEIFRHAAWQTPETENRMVRASMETQPWVD